MKLLFFILLACIPLALVCYFLHAKKTRYNRPDFQTLEQIVRLFPSTKEELENEVKNACSQIQEDLKLIYSFKPEERTFDNTMRALDLAGERFLIIAAVAQVLSLVSPDETIRKAGQEALVKLTAFGVDNFTLNEKLFKACEEYETLFQKNPTKERLNDEEKYYIKEIMRDFRRSGLQLPKDKQAVLRKVANEISALEMQFEMNIAAKQRSIEVTKEELKGLNDTFINSLKKNEKGLYIVGTDFPTFTKVMDECAVSDTRKKLGRQYTNNAYPANEEVLTKLIGLRDELAKLLGYPSYAAYDIENTMAKTPERAQSFVDRIIKRARPKMLQESQEFKKDLPEGVTLTPDGKFHPWDLNYIIDHYKKKHFNVNEAELTEYFPVDHTLPALFSLYEKFFGISFKKVTAPEVWHTEVEFWAAYKEGTYLGMVMLDLYPRPYKYTHLGVKASIVPSLKMPNGKRYPGVMLVIANFPPPQNGKPALLTRQNVIVFFHEFGHAIHSLLGATELSQFSGTNVKEDFKEMPSQMLEEWIWQPQILKLISSHYQTKKPLPDNVIHDIIKMKNFQSGDYVTRQLFLADEALAFFAPGAHKDIKAIDRTLFEKIRPNVYYDPDSHYYCSFIHLNGYGARYYGYMWSKVFALDLFSYIKPYGLFCRMIGEKYIRDILAPGGSKEPEEMLKTFLGREPNEDAFFKDLGI